MPRWNISTWILLTCLGTSKWAKTLLLHKNQMEIVQSLLRFQTRILSEPIRTILSLLSKAAWPIRMTIHLNKTQNLLSNLTPQSLNLSAPCPPLRNLCFLQLHQLSTTITKPRQPLFQRKNSLRSSIRRLPPSISSSKRSSNSEWRAEKPRVPKSKHNKLSWGRGLMRKIGRQIQRKCPKSFSYWTHPSRWEYKIGKQTDMINNRWFLNLSKIYSCQMKIMDKFRNQYRVKAFSPICILQIVIWSIQQRYLKQS